MKIKLEEIQKELKVRFSFAQTTVKRFQQRGTTQPTRSGVWKAIWLEVLKYTCLSSALHNARFHPFFQIRLRVSVEGIEEIHMEILKNLCI